nr:hypothetical protein [Tanacetum cinerariifolium]
MLVEQEVDEERDADENVEEVNAGDADKGDDSAAHGEVPTVTEEPSIPSPTPPTLPPQPPQDIPSTSQVQQTPPQSPQEDKIKPAKVEEVVDVVTTAKLIIEVVAAATIDHVKLKAKEDPAVKKYQTMKRKPQTEAQARKNMMMYLKNVVSFKMDYFKGMSYDDIRLIFEAKFKLNVAFLLKIKEQTEEDENRALQKLNETPIERAAKMRKLDEEVDELKRHLQIVPNEDDDVYTEATPLARKDLEALWNLVKERFSTTKPNNFFDDFLLVTLGAMFEKPDIHAQIWKNQRIIHGPAKVKVWKLLESCAVQIITFTSTRLILLVERKVVEIHSTTALSRPARMMVEYILHQAKEQDLDQASRTKMKT